MRYRWDLTYPGSHAGSNMRVSDAERNEAADKLSRHFADGRLDQAEFKARLDKAMNATTRGDLDGLFVDLPRLASDAAPPRRARHGRVLLFAILLALFVIAAGSTVTMVRVPWLLFVVVGLLVWHGIARRHHHHHGPGAVVDR